MDLLEDLGCGYVFGLPGNARLTRIGQPWCEDVAVRRVRSRKHQVRRFFQTGYQAGSWSRERTVIARRGHIERLRHTLHRHEPALPVQGEPPQVYRRAFGSNIRLLFHVRSRFHRTSPLLRAA